VIKLALSPIRENKRGRIAKAYVVLADVNKAVEDSQEILLQNVEMINQATMAINLMHSSLNAIQYKVEDVKSQIATLSSQAGYISGMAPILSTAQSNLSQYSMKIEKSFRELEAGIMAMGAASNKIDEFMAQPGIRRTMEELTEISRRYDSIP
jgi:DNA repair ATPase RecN